MYELSADVINDVTECCADQYNINNCTINGRKILSLHLERPALLKANA